jgi:NTP pyrophosphatase (non-canonical NTP hydrolase)
VELKELSKKALEIKEKYHELERKKIGRTWTNSEIMEGFVVDVGELMRIVMEKEGIRKGQNIDEELEHEMGDCLYSLLVLSEKYGIDLEKAFGDTMDKLKNRIDKEIV